MSSTKSEPFFTSDFLAQVNKQLASAKEASAGIAAKTDATASSASSAVASWYNSFTATDAVTQIDRWLRDNLTADATIYDRAMDAHYIASGEGGALHRVIDGSHDLAGAWSAVSSASDTDSLVQEVSGYLSAIWNDLATPMGIPVISVEKGAFDSAAVELNDALGISKTTFADALSVNATELLGPTIGALALVLNWNDEDVANISRLTGALIPTTVLAANPLLLLVAIVALARSYHLAKHGDDFGGMVSGLAQGGVGSAAFVVAVSAVSGPVWVSIVVGVLAFILASKMAQETGRRMSSIDWAGLAAWIVGRFRRAKEPDGQPQLLLLPAP